MSNILEEFLEIESNPQILDYKIDGIPLWLLVRHYVIWNLQKEKFGLEEPHVQIKFNTLKLKEKLRYFYWTLRKTPFFAPKRDILIFGSAGDNVYENERYFNKLYYQIINNFEGVLLEQSFKWKFFLPKLENTFYIRDSVEIIRFLFSKLISLNNDEKKLLKDFVKNFNLQDILDLKYVEKIIKTQKAKKAIYKILLRKIKPRLLILECAHYMGDLPILLLAKEMGIITAEYQHGYIGKDHIAYNFHPNIIEKIKPFVPEYFLTWGRYWSNNVNTPSKKVAIGFGYLEEKNKNKINKKKKILVVISGGNMPMEYNQYAKQIKEMFKDYKLLIRPHPSERPQALQRYKNMLNLGFSIDFSDLYNELLPNVDVMISFEKSTVLYEALFFTSNVFLVDLKNLFFDDDLPFKYFSDFDEFKNFLKNSSNFTGSIEKEFFFSKGFVKNFNDFLKMVLGGK